MFCDIITGLSHIWRLADDRHPASAIASAFAEAMADKTADRAADDPQQFFDNL